MAVTTTAKLDAARLRADFPIFEQQIHGKPLAYLDSAVSNGLNYPKLKSGRIDLWIRDRAPGLLNHRDIVLGRIGGCQISVVDGE